MIYTSALLDMKKTRQRMTQSDTLLVVTVNL